MTFEELSARLTTEGFKDKTLLGIEALSKNIVDATVEIVNVLKIPIQIGATYDEIDSESHSGGYVNNWTTEEFVKYIRQTDKHNLIFIARNKVQVHGVNKLDMRRLYSSLATDIEAGIELISFEPAPLSEILPVIEHCERQANASSVVYEVYGACAEEIKALHPKIKFMSACVGNEVVETHNRGYSSNLVRQYAKDCKQHGLLLREHNLDYAADLVLKDHLVNGVRGANISVELGVAEMTSLIDFLSRGKHKPELKQLIDIAYQTKKWEQWLDTDSKLNKQQKAIICGHCVFSDPAVRSIRVTLNREVYFDDVTKADIGTHLLKYLRYFGWLH